MNWAFIEASEVCEGGRLQVCLIWLHSLWCLVAICHLQWSQHCILGLLLMALVLPAAVSVWGAAVQDAFLHLTGPR